MLLIGNLFCYIELNIDIEDIGRVNRYSKVSIWHWASCGRKVEAVIFFVSLSNKDKIH